MIEAMGLSYKKLWTLLVDKNMRKADLRKVADISSNTFTKLRRNEPVTLNTLLRICDELKCNITEVVDYYPEEKQN